MSREKMFGSEAEASEFVRTCGLRWLGSAAKYLDETDSTETQARRLAELGWPDGTLVLAEYQTRGRGRLGKKWVCPARAGILVSVLIDRSRCGSLALQWLTAAGALAMAGAAGDACGARLPRPGGVDNVEWTTRPGGVDNVDRTTRHGPSPRRSGFGRAGGRADVLIEWPNDLVALSPSKGNVTRKLGGVLVEGPVHPTGGQHGGGLLAVGVGLNVDVRTEELPPELRGSAGSLLTAFGVAPDRREILGRFLRGFEERLAKMEDLPAELRERSATLGREVMVESDGSPGRARAIGFDERMRLVVKFPGGRVEAVTARLGPPLGRAAGGADLRPPQASAGPVEDLASLAAGCERGGDGT